MGVRSTHFVDRREALLFIHRQLSVTGNEELGMILDAMLGRVEPFKNFVVVERLLDEHQPTYTPPQGLVYPPERY